MQRPASAPGHLAMCFTPPLLSVTLYPSPTLQDMAEKIAQDPAFAQMTAALQQSMGGAPGAAPDAAGATLGAPTASATVLNPAAPCDRDSATFIL